MAPPSPTSLFRRFTVVMVLFTLWHFQPVLASAWLHACSAERLRSCAAFRQPATGQGDEKSFAEVHVDACHVLVASHEKCISWQVLMALKVPSSFRQLKQESAGEWRQRPAAHRSQQSVDGVVVLHCRRSVWRNVSRLAAAACVKAAAHSNTETQERDVPKL